MKSDTFSKAKTSKEYFIENFCKVITKEGNSIDIRLTDTDRKFLEVVDKADKEGKTILLIKSIRSY